MTIPKHLMEAKLCNKDTCEEIRTLKEENQRLKERIEYLERSNNRREDTIMSLRDEIIDQKDYENVLNELEKWVYQFREEHKNDTGIFDKFLTTREVLDKLNKLKERDK